MNWKPIRLRMFEVLPKQWFCYGIRERGGGVEKFPEIREEYFAVLWLPSYGFEYCIELDAPAWVQRGIRWGGLSGFGWIQRRTLTENASDQ